MVFFPPQAGRSLLILPSFMQHEKETANAISFSWRRRRDSPGGTGAGRRQPGELKNHSLDGFFPATGGSFPSHPSFFYAARKRDRKCDLFFLAEKEGFARRHWGRPPPARGTKKPFTGWFFSRHRRAVPFSSLLLLCSTKKRPQMRSLFRGGEGGIRNRSSASACLRSAPLSPA